MTRFHSSCPELAVHSNLLLKRKLPEECEQHALCHATANVPVGIRYGRHVGAHLCVVSRLRGNQILGAPRHGRDVVPVIASAINLTHRLISTLRLAI